MTKMMKQAGEVADYAIAVVNAHDDLLEALLAFRDSGPDGGKNFEGWHASYAPAIEKAIKAIAKATA